MRRTNTFLVSSSEVNPREVVFHAQIATDEEGQNIRIVTMYIPNPGKWDNELRVRRAR